MRATPSPSTVTPCPIPMPRFAANLSTMYQEWPFLDRFGAAAQDGFEAVECQFPYAIPASAVARALREHGLELVLFNLPAGNWAQGERGLACHPHRMAEFAGTVQQALDYALETGCRRLHALAGCQPTQVSDAAAQASYQHNLAYAAAHLAPHGITLLIEPINTRDVPGYWLKYQQQAHDTLAAVAAPNLQVQMDLYHCQIMEGDISRRLQRHMGQIGHIQIAGVPDRSEPNRGEIHFPHLFALIDALGYSGYIGCEYFPAGPTSDGLGWLQAWRRVAASSQQQQTHLQHDDEDQHR